ncbi:NAD-dependent epimerase/dehydratase family protein [Flavobacterium psychrotrophum]|uniref:NAD-dependent epimerase/dehydratase family protein n=1 Tax=Flavobacterium psychrotrophum TaxID=2294119 RepID=UPI000E310258|nr:NAD-dependent epimerase/dehydratase family protein [Flavobacterium psychrotrophum]
MSIKVIITGATGMVGEGVLFECLENPDVSEILIIGRRAYGLQHPKVKELTVPDFFTLDSYANQISGYDACLFCAGISSVGMNEEKYTHITYDTTRAFANSVLKVNPSLVFCFVSGSQTDGTEKGSVMWARVKGRTENALAQLSFTAEYNFRPGVMLTAKGQKNGKPLYYSITKVIQFFSAKSVITLSELGKAMINAITKGYDKQVLEISDIKKLAKV